MTRFGFVFLLLAACASPPPLPEHPAVSQLSLPIGDVNNLCRTRTTSPVLSLPADDIIHYPERVSDPFKANFQPGVNPYNPQIGAAFESTFKFWNWDAVPVGGGPVRRISGYRAYFVVQIPDQNGNFNWFRLLLMDFFADDDPQHHLYLYAAPGKYADVSNSYDMAIGGAGEFLVFEGTSFGLVPIDPSVVVGHATGSGGVNLTDVIATTDGQFKVNVVDQEVGRPAFPFDDGQGSPLYRPWSYYWARPQLAGAGTITYAGQRYAVAGTSWEERQWPGSLGLFKWRWVSIQIKGCLNNAGQKVLCGEGGALGLVGGRTIAAFDIQERVSGIDAFHDYTEVGPLPGCEEYHLKGVSDWTLSVESSYQSQVTPHVFADKVRLTAPSRGVDLMLTALVQNAETYLVESAFPGSWEGAMDVVGTVGGKRVWGVAFLEQFNQP